MKNLVLIGGGHSHAIALRRLGMHPLAADIRLILITNVIDTPYSGMLPAYISGYYSFKECHINLTNLAKFAQANLVLDSAINLDLANKRVLCQNHAPIDFDWLSIDIGSTPAAIANVDDHIIPIKPVPNFLKHWHQFLTELEVSLTREQLRIGIVGGGAGGVELSLAIKIRIEAILRSQRLSPSMLEIHLFHRQSKLMTGYPPNVGRQMEKILKQQGIYIHLCESVSKVTSSQTTTSLSNSKLIICDSGLTLDCDRVFWVTSAIAPDWIRSSGLATDEKGFILINDRLQSISNPTVFATGDIATSISDPRPKAGVFAVRQAGPLYHNLRRITSQQPLRSFYPQKRSLSLIGVGCDARSNSQNLQVIAAWDWLCIGPSKLLWQWKESIDRKFMQLFENP
ncbi:MAG: FAD-dependent oxidoreductase [Oscillatoriales cyanobacterium CG2_30_44_21]|nr:MAG: FAD-dependent oxidoreductase [Oscillatoriales cyanobacterium CG2_30_44_21]